MNSLRSMKKAIVVTAFSVFAAGCAATIEQCTSQLIGTERITEKSYEIGQRYAAYVGQPLVRVRDYRVKKEISTNVKPSADFKISYKNIRFSGSEDNTYPILGETKIQGKTYYVISPGPSKAWPNAKMLISVDGKPYNRLYLGEKMFTFRAVYSPKDLRFARIVNKIVDRSAQYTNYELVYGGTDGDSITITYREYTPDDLARPAFFQNVVYDSNQPKIRFRNTEIIVHKATNEKIEYTVVADGLD